MFLRYVLTVVIILKLGQILVKQKQENYVRNNQVSLYPQAHEVKGYVKHQTYDSDLVCPFCLKKFSTAVSLKTLDIIVVLFY